MRGEPRVFRGDLRIDARERRAELVPVRLERDDLVDEALAALGAEGFYGLLPAWTRPRVDGVNTRVDGVMP